MQEKTTDFHGKLGIFLPFYLITPPKTFSWKPWPSALPESFAFATFLPRRCLAVGTDDLAELASHGRTLGRSLRNQISRRGEAPEPQGPCSRPLPQRHPRAGLEPGPPGSPLGMASCLPAAPEGQRGPGSAVSQALRLPLIHFTLSILIGSALSPVPPLAALPPAGCCTAGQPSLHAA